MQSFKHVNNCYLISFQFWCDYCCSPSQRESQFDIILSLNCKYGSFSSVFVSFTFTFTVFKEGRLSGGSNCLCIREGMAGRGTGEKSILKVGVSNSIIVYETTTSVYSIILSIWTPKLLTILVLVLVAVVVVVVVVIAMQYSSCCCCSNNSNVE